MLFRSPFAQVHDEQNCLVLKTECGQSLTVSGRGAGRWPTAEAVFADTLDLWRNQQSFNTGRQSHNEKKYVWSAAAGVPIERRVCAQWGGGVLGCGGSSLRADRSPSNSSAEGTPLTGGAA